ncbi:hypothetical protein FKM82_028798 [Ascaphus truei]
MDVVHCVVSIVKSCLFSRLGKVHGLLQPISEYLLKNLVVIGSRLIGLQFLRSSLSPFLWMRIAMALLHYSGMSLFKQHVKSFSRILSTLSPASFKISVVIPFSPGDFPFFVDCIAFATSFGRAYGTSLVVYSRSSSA